ncbi:hypothetical protein GALMADRAFT_229150 [Galerina marginata CBS 339.88]|uniref:JmjC domain-containing protein n=1 Tax=Galerina marginata (strain CBS 339.88) TaxID=685588 RepID=A0A067SN81_GALM3|nr:hypothetical protein GALMADRAFT_229150 [Galerina marginata CBS 339.88]
MSIAIMTSFEDNHPTEKIPFIPEKVDEFAARISALASQQSDSSSSNLFGSLPPNVLIPRESKNKETMRYMKSPITLAALLSPIYLLLPVNLITAYIGKLETLMISKRIGNTKPRELQCAEQQIWKALFAISTGKKAPLNALLECIDEIDWADIKSVDSSGWFSEGFDDENSPVLDNVNDYHLAAAVPASWPSSQFFLGAKAIEAENGMIEPSNSQSDHSLAQPEAEGTIDPASAAEGDASSQNENALLNPNAVTRTTESPAGADTSSSNGNVTLPGPIAGSDMSADGDCAKDVDLASQKPALATNAESQTVLPTRQTEPLENAEGRQSSNTDGETINPTTPKDPLVISNEHNANSQPSGPNPAVTATTGDGNANDSDQDKNADPSGAPKKPDPKGPKKPNKSESKKPTGGREKRKEPPKNHRKKGNDKHSRSVTVQPMHSKSQDLPAPPDILESQALDKIFEVIDIEDIQSGRPKPSLDINNYPTKASHPTRPTFTVYTPRGHEVTLSPKLHTVEEVKALYGMVDAAKETSSENGSPFFISQPKKSIFRLMTEVESTGTYGPQLLQLLASNVLIITGCAVEKVGFDEDGLSELKDLGAIISVHDCSIPSKDGDYAERSKQTTLGHVLECSRHPDGKILNVLDLPLGWKGAIPMPFSSETRAWMATEGLPYCKTPLPADAIRWALAATAGAHHSWHIDANGFGAKILVGCGGKLVFVGRPRTRDAFQNVGMFLNKMDMYSPCTERWDVESIYLETGDAIIIPPNMPHSVYTADHAICYGGHYFASTTMQDTLIAVIHNFFCYHISTNTDHPEWRDFIHCITTFFHQTIVTGSVVRDPRALAHIPHLSDLKSLLSVFSTCALAILMNALSPKTYELLDNAKPEFGVFNLQRARHEEFDLNIMTGFDRRKCVHHRALAWEIVHHIDAKYKAEIQSSGIALSIFDDIFVPFISHLCKATLNYHTQVIGEKVRSLVDLSNDEYGKQLRACFHEHPEILKAIDDSVGTGNLIFSFNFDCKLSLATDFVDVPVAVKTSGHTTCDLRYESGRENQWELYYNISSDEEDAMDTDPSDEGN